MATGKRCYWIKLTESFMNSDTVDYFMSQPNGASYVVLYQMLCLKTINTGGRLSTHLGEIIIQYDVEKIKRDCKWFSAATVRVALELYKECGLIYEDKDGILVLTGYSDLVVSETDYAEKKRLQRVAKAQGQLTSELKTGHNMSPDVSPDVSNNVFTYEETAEENNVSSNYSTEVGDETPETSFLTCSERVNLTLPAMDKGVDNTVDNVHTDVHSLEAAQKEREKGERKERRKEAKEESKERTKEREKEEKGGPFQAPPEKSRDGEAVEPLTASLSAEPEQFESRHLPSCPYREIREMYHTLCPSYPQIRAIDGRRQIAVNARWRAHPSLDVFRELFANAEASSFLKGQNNRNWHADFDWMMRATNFAKILERKYDDRPAADQGNSVTSWGEGWDYILEQARGDGN